MPTTRSHFTTLIVGKPRVLRALGGLLALSLAACGGPGDQVTISTRRVASAVRHAEVGMSSSQRFGRESMPSAQAQANQAPVEREQLLFDLPSGWKALEPTSMRLVNLQPAGDPDASCYVSILGGDGGGLAANLNRWRGQLGLDPAPAEELEALPKVSLAGAPGTLIELVGDYRGMGSEVQANWGLMGVVPLPPQATLFVKMTAPAELVAQEREAFLAFVESLHFGLPGHEHADEESAPEASKEAAALGTFTANGFRFHMPDGWQDAGPKTMRTLNFRVGEETECYLVVLGGDGGGLAANLNRWQGQMGLDPLSDEDIAALPRIPMLGGEATLLTAQGDYAGMGGAAGLDHTMLAAALIRPQDAVFLKMVGPDEEVAAARGAFIDFAASLEEVR